MSSIILQLTIQLSLAANVVALGSSRAAEMHEIALQANRLIRSEAYDVEGLLYQEHAPEPEPVVMMRDHGIANVHRAGDAISTVRHEKRIMSAIQDGRGTHAQRNRRKRDGSSTVDEKHPASADTSADVESIKGKHSRKPHSAQSKDGRVGAAGKSSEEHLTAFGGHRQGADSDSNVVGKHGERSVDRFASKDTAHNANRHTGAQGGAHTPLDRIILALVLVVIIICGVAFYAKSHSANAPSSVGDESQLNCSRTEPATTTRQPYRRSSLMNQMRVAGAVEQRPSPGSEADVDSTGESLGGGDGSSNASHKGGTASMGPPDPNLGRMPDFTST